MAGASVGAFRYSHDELVAAAREMGLDDAAIDVLQRVEGEGFAEASSLLAEIFQATGETDRAVDLLQGLIDADPPIYAVDQALLELGKIRMERGESELARQDWQRIVNEFPARGAVEEARTLLGS